MSRAINVNATQAEVIKSCSRHGAAVSAIETLASGGTRVVLMNITAAETMRVAFGRKLLKGAVRRTPLRTWAL